MEEGCLEAIVDKLGFYDDIKIMKELIKRCEILTPKRNIPDKEIKIKLKKIAIEYHNLFINQFSVYNGDNRELYLELLKVKKTLLEKVEKYLGIPKLEKIPSLEYLKKIENLEYAWYYRILKSDFETENILTSKTFKQSLNILNS